MSLIQSELPDSLYTAAEVRELDRISIEQFGIPGFELMQRAANALFECMRLNWPEARKITVLCGGGNNAGDGYLLGKLAYDAGLKVRLLAIGDITSLGADAAMALKQCESAGMELQGFDISLIKEADVVVDGLLGSGLDRPLNEEWHQIVQQVNETAAAVLAIDVPSGLHADSGCALDVAIRADATVTFIGVKRGLLGAQGPAHCGKLYFASLDVPSRVYQQVPATLTRISSKSQSALLPKRSRVMHKGECGHVLMIGGDYGFAGAIRLAGEAALRVGAGLVTIATRPEHATSVALARPELMTLAVNTDKDIQEIMSRADVLVIGPGLGQSEWALQLLARVFQSQLPMVVDADALNLLAGDVCQSPRWVLTPHPGEAARLLNTDTASVQRDRFAAVRDLQQKYDGVCLLKGPGSLVADSDGGLSLCDAGNPGMASGGMGDVLSGVIAGLLAQGMSTSNAARLGVCVHAEAADRAARAGERGLLASDLMPELRALVNPA